MWIALKSWYLWYSEQPIDLVKIAGYCCELLSKVDIFDIRNNPFTVKSNSCSVVNCSQKLISLIFGTTEVHGIRLQLRLWIALKSWYLWYSEQLITLNHIVIVCCELLSKVDIFDIRNNLSWIVHLYFYVVNCSQKLISLIFGTTGSLHNALLCLLWIALKSWYLWYSEQLNEIIEQLECCCELLSKVDIFDIRNNVFIIMCFFAFVVNCSQKLISLIFGTTSIKLSIYGLQLWIALKSWYLWYSEQLHPPKECDSIRCELLSKVDIFDIRNNFRSLRLSVLTVVNCSQKLISLIFGTTYYFEEQNH